MAGTPPGSRARADHWARVPAQGMARSPFQEIAAAAGNRGGRVQAQGRQVSSRRGAAGVRGGCVMQACSGAGDG
jgi:hypothetical protein